MVLFCKNSKACLQAACFSTPVIFSVSYLYFPETLPGVRRFVVSLLQLKTMEHSS
ncbi:hypothetical protein RG47T_1277 [Mucilaginibacter polytrichastri]|uniref:Uncharacterized protein n=1 Tax=Mucilaginibacter polytrichastri TaxID=1302689 RepID=A0A1Q5ZVN9_9SPHI|nr:hypothetical protein RG47T_1277 [Mucilaginibacter polytrichastri]